jgi:Uncharacterized conserved protein
MIKEFTLSDDIDQDQDQETGVITRTRPRTQKPPMYKVLLLNDDYTPMEFVVLVLIQIFRMNQEQATQVMLHVHTKRCWGLWGLYL